MKPMDSQLQWYTHSCQIKAKWEHWLPLLPGFCDTEVLICLKCCLLLSSFLLYLDSYTWIQFLWVSSAEVDTWGPKQSAVPKKDGWLCFRHEKVGARGLLRICLVNHHSVHSFLLLIALASTPVTKLSGSFLKKLLTAIVYFQSFFFFLCEKFSTKKKERMRELLLLVSFVLFWNVVQYWR